MLTQEVKEVASLIGHYYLQKNNGDYEKAEKDIEDLRISKIEVSKMELHTITITSARIGLLIGKRGTNVNALEKFLNAEPTKWWTSVKVRLVEDTDNLLEWLVPIKPEEWSHYE